MGGSLRVISRSNKIFDSVPAPFLAAISSIVVKKGKTGVGQLIPIPLVKVAAAFRLEETEV